MKLSHRCPEVTRFIEHVKSLCEEFEVKLSIRNTTYIWCDRVRCTGYFDPNTPEMRVAKHNPRSLDIFAHEFGHMTQWIDKTSIWNKAKLDHNKLELWFDGKKVHHINDIIDEIRDIEHDNEMRTVELIKKFKLPIDTKKYIQEANSYLLFYEHIKNSRRWSRPDNSPYNNKHVVAACPTYFLDDYTAYFPKVQWVYEEQNI